MVHKNEQLTELIQAALRSGRLPPPGGHRIFGGKGEGQRCACCGEIITSAQVQYDVEIKGHADSLAMHLRCYQTWEACRYSQSLT